MQYPRYCTGYESDHIHNKVQQKRERGRRTKKKKKKKKEETEEEAVASWRHPYFVVIFPFLLCCVFYFFILGSDSMGCFMAPPFLRRRLLPFLLFCVSFFSFWFKFNGKQGTMRTGLITILRTVRSDRGSYGSLFFSHRTVLEAKRTAKMNGSRFFQSDHTVRSGFQNLAANKRELWNTHSNQFWIN